MPASPIRSLLAALTVACALAACGDEAESVASTPPTNEANSTPPETVAPAETVAASWSFTDDIGVTIELPQQPQRVVMFEDAAASLMDFGVRPAGILYRGANGESEIFEGIDRTGIESVGACREVNIEAIAALDADLFIATQWNPDTSSAFCIEPEQLQQIQEVVPVLRVSAVGDAGSILGRYSELAAALGADLDAADNVAKRERYETAATSLRSAVAARPEISVIPISIAAEWAGVAEPGGYADLVTLRDDFGVTLAGPFGPEFTEAFWQEYSPETITTHRADLVLLDMRAGQPPIEDLEGPFPLWTALPEVRAGQIVPWYVPASFSYTRDAEFMETLAAAIESAQDLVTD